MQSRTLPIGLVYEYARQEKFVSHETEVNDFKSCQKAIISRIVNNLVNRSKFKSYISHEIIDFLCNTIIWVLFMQRH